MENSILNITKTELIYIETLRDDYLNTLPEFQELYLEMLVEDGQYYMIYNYNETVGYFIKTSDNILIEFYLKDQFIPHCSNLFTKIVLEFSITTVYCKSFDPLLLNCCLMNLLPYEIYGILFRNYVTTNAFNIDDMSVKVADLRDYSFLLQQKDGLYETPEELDHFIKGGNVLMFTKSDKLLGCGYLIRVHRRWDFYDIGMWVNPDFRKQGIGTAIISYLKEYCLENNKKPICGCASENIASQKTLERNGFVSKYKLLKFSVIK